MAEKLIVNPDTGDAQLVFDPDSIITHELNSAGYPIQTHSAGPANHADGIIGIVTNDKGQVVTT